MLCNVSRCYEGIRFGLHGVVDGMDDDDDVLR